MPELPGVRTDDDRTARIATWEACLQAGAVPDFVAERLTGAAAGRAPWISTMTPAELLIAKTHGVRPIATVSGNCWMQVSYLRSCSGVAQGHAEGWNTAIHRLQQEAVAAGADAVVDVRLAHQSRHGGVGGVEFSVIGTAVRIAGMERPKQPVLATVPALEFVRMVESGVVPTGIAIGAAGDMVDGIGLGAMGAGYGPGRGYGAGSYSGGFFGNFGMRQRIASQSQGWTNQPITDLTDFWERIRRQAIADLHASAARLGNGVLAHSHHSRLVRIEVDKQPPDWAGEHIIIGTAIDASAYRNLQFDVALVTDLRDASPLGTPWTSDNVYPQDKDTLSL